MKLLLVVDINEETLLSKAQEDDPSLDENFNVIDAVKSAMNWVHDDGVHLLHVIDINGTECEIFGGETEDKLIQGCTENIICQVNPGNVVHFIAGPIDRDLEINEGEYHGEEK